MSRQYDDQIRLIKHLHRWRMAFFGLVILIAGILIGAGLTPLITGRRSSRILPGVEFINEQTIRHLQRELKLRPEQTEEVAAICDKHLKALQEIREQARPKIASQMNQLYTDVRAVLDEQQQQLWKQSIRRLRDRFMAPPHERPPHGPGPEGHFPPPPHRPFDFWEEGSGHRPPPPHEPGGIRPPHYRPEEE